MQIGPNRDVAGLELIIPLRQAFMGVGHYRVKLPSPRGLIGLADSLDTLCKHFSEPISPSSPISFGAGSLDVCQRDT
jgi:hypothetical protein